MALKWRAIADSQEKPEIGSSTSPASNRRNGNRPAPQTPSSASTGSSAAASRPRPCCLRRDRAHAALALLASGRDQMRKVDGWGNPLSAPRARCPLTSPAEKPNLHRPGAAPAREVPQLLRHDPQIVNGREIVTAEFQKITDEAYTFFSNAFRERVEAVGNRMRQACAARRYSSVYLAAAATRGCLQNAVGRVTAHARASSPLPRPGRHRPALETEELAGKIIDLLCKGFKISPSGQFHPSNEIGKVGFQDSSRGITGYPRERLHTVQVARRRGFRVARRSGSDCSADRAATLRGGWKTLSRRAMSMKSEEDFANHLRARRA